MLAIELCATFVLRNAPVTATQMVLCLLLQSIDEEIVSVMPVKSLLYGPFSKSVNNLMPGKTLVPEGL